MRFIPDKTFIAQLQASPEYRAAALDWGKALQDAAEAVTPRGSDPRRGHVADKYVTEEIPNGVSVGNTDPFFHLVEWGSAKNPPYAPLRRGVQAVGLRFVENRAFVPLRRDG